VVIDRSDAAGFGRAAFVCWIVALTGYERCSVMTGGIEAWRAAGFGLTSGPLTARPQPGDLAPIPPDPAALAPLTLVRAATTNAEPALIDVRSLGAGPGIPGSTQLPLEALLLPGGAIDRSRLDTAATRAGLFGEHGMIVLGEGRYDGALGWFVLARTLGLRDVRLYPEGLARWRQVPEVPGGAAASPAPQRQPTTGAH
jgi:thiosulfate/3-mercaptopyruvate sulfurtransferase